MCGIVGVVKKGHGSPTGTISSISTDLSDLRDIARQEPTCWICPADPVVLADNICDVLASQQQPDLRRHVASMSLDAVSDRLVTIYESLLSRHRSADGRAHQH